MSPVCRNLLLFLFLFSFTKLKAGGPDLPERVQLLVREPSTPKQDSLLQLAIDEAQKTGRDDYQMRLYHLWSFLKVQQSDYAGGVSLARQAVDIGIASQQLRSDVSFRDAIVQLVLAYSYIGKEDSAWHWIDYGIPLCRDVDPFNHSLLLSLSGIRESVRGRMRESGNYFDQAFALAQKTPNPHDDVMSLFNKAELLLSQGDWGGALSVSTSFQDRLDDPALGSVPQDPLARMPFMFRNAKHSLYHTLAVAYFALSDIDDACYYQAKIVEAYKARENFRYLPYVWCDLAEMETFRSPVDKIQHIYDSCRQLIATYAGDDEIPFHSFYYTGGWLAEKEGRYNEAIRLYTKASGLPGSQFSISIPALLRVYASTENYAAADSLIRHVNASVKARDAFFRILFLQEQARLLEKKGQSSSARDKWLDYYRLRDSLHNAARYYMVLEVERKFQTKEKEKELNSAIAGQEAQRRLLQQRRRAIMLLIAGAALLTGLCFLLYRFYRARKTQAQLLEKKNNQVETLVRELHHRVKNNLQVVSSLMALQVSRLDDDNARKALEEGRSRVDAMALIHQKLYMDEELAAVDMQVYLQTLATMLAGSYGYTGEQVSVNVILKQPLLDVDQAMPLGLMTNELLSNAFKHSFPVTANPHVQLSLTEENNKLLLRIADNGPGVADTQVLEKSNSFGFKLIRLLTAQLNGTMHISISRGLVITIEMERPA
jgi:two-component sensor histidine kinase